MVDADYYVGKQDILFTLVPVTPGQTKEEHKSVERGDAAEKYILTDSLFIFSFY